MSEPPFSYLFRMSPYCNIRIIATNLNRVLQQAFKPMSMHSCNGIALARSGRRFPCNPLRDKFDDPAGMPY
jgi:hypothetical protein